jgi:hypothetical protein
MLLGRHGKRSGDLLEDWQSKRFIPDAWFSWYGWQEQNGQDIPHILDLRLMAN